jgi:hypothetical protein
VLDVAEAVGRGGRLYHPAPRSSSGRETGGK